TSHTFAVQVAPPYSLGGELARWLRTSDAATIHRYAVQSGLLFRSRGLEHARRLDVRYVIMVFSVAETPVWYAPPRPRDRCSATTEKVKDWAEACYRFPMRRSNNALPPTSKTKRSGP